MYLAGATKLLHRRVISGRAYRSEQSDWKMQRTFGSIFWCWKEPFSCYITSIVIRFKCKYVHYTTVVYSMLFWWILHSAFWYTHLVFEKCTFCSIFQKILNQNRLKTWYWSKMHRSNMPLILSTTDDCSAWLTRTFQNFIGNCRQMYFVPTICDHMKAKINMTLH